MKLEKEIMKERTGAMNYKLEKFWNGSISSAFAKSGIMNYKLEKFWNSLFIKFKDFLTKMNYKLEKFWNYLVLFISIILLLHEL